MSRQRSHPAAAQHRSRRAGRFEKPAPQLEDWAFYYPGPVWDDSDAIKNLVLFFDGLAVLVPNYLRGKPLRIDPAIAAGLTDNGLLRELEPETFIDRAAAEELATQLVDLLASGALDHLRVDDAPFEELSMSRLGSVAAPELAEMVFDELVKRRLARATEDGVSIPMHRAVRAAILVLLAQILAPRGPNIYNIGLSPCTDRPALVRGLVELLHLPGIAHESHVMQMDVEHVGVDLSAVPIDEVLGFRRENYSAYRAYVIALRRFMRESTALPINEQDRLQVDRRREIDELRRDVLERARRAWRRPASFGLGLAGCLWLLGHGDAVGGLIAMGLGLTGLGEVDRRELGAYSYLFAAQNRFPVRTRRRMT